MYTTVWQYTAAPGREAAFEAFYGADGPWVRLFRGAPAYHETRLLRDLAEPGRYVTLDRWESEASYTAFLAASRDAYEQLDRAAAELTVSERHLGSFSS